MAISFRPMREYMQKNHISYYYLGNEGIDARTLHRIRHDLPVTTTTLNAVCRIMHCQPGELIEYIEEKPDA
ncbi:MAG: helix-turn-helix transcriptional regulator [Clostridia bacterium]|nr:helix-turn-helix transcriptional regulator [Clostridia bacterium]